MCTLVLSHGVVPGFPLVVVANRDEALDRPARPPFVWPAGFLAPRDERALGTWLGVARGPLFVGITNRFLGPRDASRASRGEIVARALEAPSARAIHDLMRGVDPRRYNGFHLVYADARDVFATFSDGESLAQVSLGPGTHVVTERSFGAADDGPRKRRIEAAWQRLAAPPADGSPLDVERLTALLAEHDPAEPLASTCIHVPGLNYGTRSGMVLALGADPAQSVMLWAEGPPCTTPFARVDLAPVLGAA